MEAWNLELLDELLIEKTLVGSLDCFDVLMQRYQRDVFAVARGYTDSRDDALDICQNTFLKAYRKLGTFAGRSSFRTWVTSIAAREGLNWVRTRSRKAPATIPEDKLASIPSGDDHESALLEAERRQLVIDHLHVLNPRSRMAVILRYFREMPVSEIAAVLDCSEGVTRNMLFRSVRKLRDAVATQ
jgi:RNA polymerase sigma-70 factor (ECF subfamily)